jgi:hypothetical protein
MKTSLFVLFAILLVSFNLHSALKFEYTTVSKTENSQNTQLIQVIKSHNTHVKLNPVKDFNKVDKYSYKSIGQNSNDNSDLSKSERFKALESESNQIKYEVPVIIPSQPVNNNSNEKGTMPSQMNRKRDFNEFGFDVDFQNRINDSSVQSVSNKQAFNAIYPNSEDFKNKVAVKVFDLNYDRVKADFSAKLYSILEENLIGMPVTHASDLKKPYQKISLSNQDFPGLDPEELNEIKGQLNDENSNKVLTYRKK